jgi:hypothetical protein
METQPDGFDSRDSSRYRSLGFESINSRITTLHQRIQERFPRRNLTRICGELVVIGHETEARIASIARPNYPLRALIGLLIVLLVLALLIAGRGLSVPNQKLDLFELVQIFDSGVNDVIFFGAGIIFLVTLEGRLKRRKILAALHELRALAHVIDMHQLTKDPQRILAHGPNTPSSPKEKMTPFELTRYLDYSSEMLALIGKIAAIYAQNFEDSTTLATVNEIEALTSALSRKIWQKIMIMYNLEEMQPVAADRLINPEIESEENGIRPN